MPVRVIEVAEGLGGLILGEGAVTADELIWIAHQILAREEWLFRWLFVATDLGGAQSVTASAEELRRIARENVIMSNKLRKGFLNPIVVPGNLVFGLARMWQVFAQETGWRTTVVRTRAEAEDWIRVELERTGLALPLGPLLLEWTASGESGAGSDSGR